MIANTEKKNVWQSVIIFTGLPLFIWAMSTFPERSLLKESLSVVTILAFFQMVGQFFWTRANKSAVAQLTMSKIIKYHKIIGYIVVMILLIHPFLLVLPRLFESGVAPVDAFVTIITTLHRGVVLGLIAWSLMLALAVMSLVRKRLPMQYKTWRVVHGMLAMVFAIIAAWHVINLGRHSTLVMSLFISMLTGGGVLFLLKTYMLKKKKTSEA